MDNTINKILNMDELALILERAKIIMKMDLGAFCIQLLEFICPDNNERCRAYLINDVSGQNLLMKLQA